MRSRVVFTLHLCASIAFCTHDDGNPPPPPRHPLPPPVKGWTRIPCICKAQAVGEQVYGFVERLRVGARLCGARGRLAAMTSSSASRFVFCAAATLLVKSHVGASISAE